MGTARDIENIVRNAARRQKEDELKKSVAEKNISTDAAMNHRKQIDEEIVRKRFDHAKILKVSIAIFCIFAIFFIAITTLYYVKFQEKDVWKVPSALPSDYTNASEFVATTIKKTAKKGNIEEFFAAGTPHPWIKSAKNIFSDPGIRNYTVKNVEIDMCKLGNEAVFHVQCSNPAGDEITFVLLMSDGAFKIMKIRGNPAIETKKEEGKKNEK